MRTKLKATTPKDADGVMLMLKRYANLLFVLSSSQQCPLHIQLYEIVKALKSLCTNPKQRYSGLSSYSQEDVHKEKWWGRMSVLVTSLTHNEVPSDLLLLTN
jgi:hypothetical protein